MIYIVVNKWSNPSFCLVHFHAYESCLGFDFIVLAVLQGIYWGLGTGCGSIFGGYCLERVGFSQTFLVFTVITCVVAFVFLIVQLLSYLVNPETLEEISSEASSNFYGDDEDDSNVEEIEGENDSPKRYEEELWSPSQSRTKQNGNWWWVRQICTFKRIKIHVYNIFSCTWTDTDYLEW